MKKIIIAFIILIIGTGLKAQTVQDINGLISLDEVLKELESKYYSSGSENIKIISKPDEWQIAVYDYNKKDYVYETFWSAENKTFKKLEQLSAINANNRTNNKMYLFKDRFRKSFDYRKLNEQPYYGYIGWENDAIKLLEKTNKKTDNILYALGRAYSSKASNLLNNNTGLSDEKTRFKLSYGQNSMTPEQLKEYRKYQHKAIEYYDKLYKQNPDFNAFVGEIQTKAANEYMTSFLNLRLFQNDEEALKELKDGIYNEFYANWAKNMLSTCEENAILFTNGDNDTYPLLYVQAKQKFRQDVLVVNLALLATDRYINYFRKPYKGADSINYYFSKDFYRSDITHFFDKIEASSDNVNSVFKKMSEDFKKSKEMGDIGINANLLKINANGKDWRKNAKLNNLINDYVVDEIKIDLSSIYYYKNNIAVIDIISQNFQKRPIYFATTTNEQYYFNLRSYFQLEGLAYRLIPATKGENSKEFIEVQKLDENIYKNYKWIKDGNFQKERNENLAYMTMFFELSNYYMVQRENGNAFKVISDYRKYFPEETVNSAYYSMKMVEFLYEMDQKAEGDNLASNVVKQFKGSILKAEKMKSSTERMKEMNYIKSKISYLEVIFQRYERYTLSDVLSNLKKQYWN